MTVSERSATLLRTIAETIGSDVDTVLALSRGPDASRDIGVAPAAEHLRSAQLLRIVRLFCTLPTDDNRTQALQILEALWTRMGESAVD